MSALLPDVDPDGLLEYSVVYTDRSVNHMSARFRQTMLDIHATLTDVYGAHRAVIVPGGGSVGMEAVARQFARGERCLVIRNGWFSYRWSQIIDTGALSDAVTVLKARATGEGVQSAFAPAPIEEVCETIARERPAVVFAPHVETSAGLMLPDDYLKAVADAVHEAGGIFVLDCVASGTAWVDMAASGVDVIISAPQKGWSGSPCAGLIMLSERATEVLGERTSDSFALDLKRWLQIMQSYLDGGHAYHATLPTDSLIVFRDVMQEIAGHGFAAVKERQAALGRGVREALVARGFPSVAAAGFEAPGVVVSHTTSEALHSGRAFAAEGVQIAAGVPLQVGEPEGFRTFRIGLFGLDKLLDVEAATNRFVDALDRVMAAEGIGSGGRRASGSDATSGADSAPAPVSAAPAAR